MFEEFAEDVDDAAGVLDLGYLAGAEGHRGAAVEEEVGDEVGVLLVLLDVILVGTAEDLPVEVARVVAGGVFAVLRELDGEAVEGGAVFADAVALDDTTREHAERFGAGECVGVEEGMRGGHDGRRRKG